MEPIKILIADRSGELETQELACKGFAVDFVTSIIVPMLEIQMMKRTVTEVPVLDELGEPTGATTTTYSEWEIDRRYSPSGAIAVHTESNNTKMVDPATFEFATAETENAVGEVDAVWALFGPGIEQLLGSIMHRMISRGSLDTPFDL